LQAAAHALVCATPCGLQVLVDGDRLKLVTVPAASAIVARLLTRPERGEVLEPLDLPGTVWLVLAIVILAQPIRGPTSATHFPSRATADGTSG
jgi:hypothetical protein